MPKKLYATPEEARRAHNIQRAEFDKRQTRRYGLKLNQNTDADVIAHLDAEPSVQGYIKRLIRDDIARARAAEPQQ